MTLSDSSIERLLPVKIPNCSPALKDDQLLLLLLLFETRPSVRDDFSPILLFFSVFSVVVILNVVCSGGFPLSLMTFRVTKCDTFCVEEFDLESQHRQSLSVFTLQSLKRCL